MKVAFVDTLYFAALFNPRDQWHERAIAAIKLKESVASQWFEDHVSSDLFYVRFKNAMRGDVVKFTFAIDVDAVPRITVSDEGLRQ